METFSIVDKINVNKLNTKIAEFVYREGHKPYIFASKETIDALIKLIDQAEMFTNSWKIGLVSSYESCLIGMYCGNKMFRDDTLKFGEIELR
jgi:hypothetical protein